MNTEIESQQHGGANKFRDNDMVNKRRGIWNYRIKVEGRWHEFSTHTRNYQEARQIRHQALQASEQGCRPIDSAKQPFETVATRWLGVARR